MKYFLMISFAVLMFTVSGCVAGESIWSRDSYVPPPQTTRGSRTYSPKTVVSPYQNYGGGQFNESSSGGSGTASGSGSR